MWSPKVAWTTSAPLPSIQRQLIQTAFGAPVCDEYGSCELRWIASQCPVGKGLHVNVEHVHIEFVDENNMPGIGRWLQENNIAKPTGVGIKSGYVTYQAYAFNVPKQSLTEVESRRRQLNTLPPRADDMRQAARPKIK
jgi:hypothetical protein